MAPNIFANGLFTGDEQQPKPGYRGKLLQKNLDRFGTHNDSDQDFELIAINGFALRHTKQNIDAIKLCEEYLVR